MNTSLETLGGDRGPFHQHPDPELFFPGAQREKICQSLILDLLHGKGLLLLGGEAGCGKTLLCRVIMERLPAEFIPVCLDDPGGSYEELLHQACLSLGHLPGETADASSWPELFDRLLQQRQAARERVVLILDQAERMFAATLERLLQRHRRGDSEQAALAILLSGTGGLQSLLGQIASLDPGYIPEASYILPPLDQEETDKYLRYRLHAAGISWNEHDTVLPEKQSTRIFKQAQGNIARTNVLAAEFLAQRPAPRREVAAMEQALPGKMSRRQPQQQMRPDAAPASRERFLWEERGASAVIGLYELLLGNRNLLTILLVAAIFLAGLGLYLDRDSSPVSPPQQRITRSDTDGEDGQLPAGRGEQAGQEVQEIEETPPPPQPNAQQVLRERLAASTALVAAAYRGASTIQLLAITGDDAEEQILRLLATPPFMHAADQLYIVKKRADQPIYFIFYGLFDTLEQARQVRNNMPFDLRAHHPYPLAITDALLLNEG